MAGYLGKRLMISVVTLLFILLILFLLLQFMPGSPFNDEKLSVEQVAVLKQKYGLDKPVIVQFFRYLGNMVRGDLGVSYSLSPNTPITDLLKNRFPVTIKMGFASMMAGTLFGLILGFLTAFFGNRILTFIYNLLTLLGIAVPSYLFAMGFSYVLGYKLKLFPLLYDFRAAGITQVMPVAAMSLGVMAVIARFAKAEASEVMKSDYVQFAKCQGLNNSTIILKYILKNSLMPVITVMAGLLVGLLTGSLVIEEMFSVPGVGSLLTNAISANDYSVVIALSFIYSLLYVVVMLILDLLYCLIDPRVRLGGKPE
ncbi:MAG: ABC transporter permease [Lachnospiraceae bacterium]|nr:ABC transporter permease [Lachnospiraceae bacterium]MBR6469801.1 ABC transporter permease [Lachnospiraceae bacterium]MBR6485708.1 ABC transporter permease [Lachnospiraceae bacterium]